MQRDASVVVSEILEELKLWAFTQCFRLVSYAVQCALLSKCLIFLWLNSEQAAVTEKRDSGSVLTTLCALAAKHATVGLTV